MSITKTLLAGVAGAVLMGGVAAASEPVKLTPTQLDDVTAGGFEVGAGTFSSIGFGLGFFNSDQKSTAEGSEKVTVATFSPLRFSSSSQGTASASTKGDGFSEPAGFLLGIIGDFQLGGGFAQVFVGAPLPPT
jgi:hypothetical protein